MSAPFLLLSIIAPLVLKIMKTNDETYFFAEKPYGQRKVGVPIRNFKVYSLSTREACFIFNFSIRNLFLETFDGPNLFVTPCIHSDINIVQIFSGK